MTRSFRLPLLGVSVPLGPAGVRILAAVSLLAAAGLVAALAGSELPSGRAHLASPIALALTLLALVATVPSLLDGRLRFLLAGTVSLCLGLVAAVAIGLGASVLVGVLGGVVVVVSAATALYHLLGSEPGARG